MHLLTMQGESSATPPPPCTCQTLSTQSRRTLQLCRLMAKAQLSTFGKSPSLSASPAACSEWGFFVEAGLSQVPASDLILRTQLRMNHFIQYMWATVPRFGVGTSLGSYQGIFQCSVAPLGINNTNSRFPAEAPVPLRHSPGNCRCKVRVYVPRSGGKYPAIAEDFLGEGLSRVGHDLASTGL